MRYDLDIWGDNPSGKWTTRGYVFVFMVTSGLVIEMFVMSGKALFGRLTGDIDSVSLEFLLMNLLFTFVYCYLWVLSFKKIRAYFLKKGAETV